MKKKKNNNKSRVVVTGMGVITSLGVGQEENWANLEEGGSGIRDITLFDVSKYDVKNAGELSDFAQYIEHCDDDLKRLDRASQFCIVAAEEALKEAGLYEKELPKPNSIILGTTLGGMISGVEFLRSYLGAGYERASFSLLKEFQSIKQVQHLARRFNFSGFCTTVSNACASGTNAIGLAFRMIRWGLADLVLAGGFDPMCEFTFSGFASLLLLSPTKCKPFDKDRDGLSLGEGAGILVLESLESARRRGTEILCEVAGYGESSDAFHITRPEPSGECAAAAIGMAIDEAGIECGDADYINAHGTGTLLNDASEVNALRKIFGDGLNGIPISSLKPAIGHILGGAGAVESVFTILAMKQKRCPPNLNFGTIDPEFGDLNIVSPNTIDLDIDVALSNSFGFGGSNAALIFKRESEV